jgi:hypothetical protein
MEPGAWGYNWATLTLGDVNTETWSSRLGLDARLITSSWKAVFTTGPLIFHICVGIHTTLLIKPDSHHAY